jgi:hypothetical protein
LQLAAYCRITDRLLVLGAIVADEINGPAVFKIAEVAGRLG